MTQKFLNILIFACSILIAAGMTACSTVDSANPADAGNSSATQPSRMSEEANRKVPSSQVEQAQTQTSLDALRRGETDTTPGDSPLKEIYFGFDRYDLSEHARATLRSAADWLRNNPAMRVEIEGHSDPRGTSEYNLALGAKRAQAAKDYLVTLGVASGRLSTTSYGEEIPACGEDNEMCWQLNRRVRFVVLPPKPKA